MVFYVVCFGVSLCVVFTLKLLCVLIILSSVVIAEWLPFRVRATHSTRLIVGYDCHLFVMYMNMHTILDIFILVSRMGFWL